MGETRGTYGANQGGYCAYSQDTHQQCPAAGDALACLRRQGCPEGTEDAEEGGDNYV